MRISLSRVPVEVFWNSFDFSQLLSWAFLAFQRRHPVRVHTSSGSLLIWSLDGKTLSISSCEFLDGEVFVGQDLATLSISHIKALFPLLFEK